MLKTSDQNQWTSPPQQKGERAEAVAHMRLVETGHKVYSVAGGPADSASNSYSGWPPYCGCAIGDGGAPVRDFATGQASS